MELTLDCNDERPCKEDGPDGYSAMTIFSSPAGCQGLTYDDIILMPGELCETLRCAASVEGGGGSCVYVMLNTNPFLHLVLYFTTAVNLARVLRPHVPREYAWINMLNPSDDITKPLG